MFILDSLMISGISWALRTVVTAAEAEMNDDTALREALLEAEMRREMGEISDDEFAEVEADLLARIREIKERREGGSGPIAFGAEPMETSAENRFHVEASISGDFHDPAAAPHTTIVEHDPGEGALLHTESDRAIQILDMAPGDATSPDAPTLPTSAGRPAARLRRASRSTSTATARRASVRRASHSTRTAVKRARTK
jgi:hypothetical protein